MVWIKSGQLFVTSNESLASFFVNTSKKHLDVLYGIIIPYLFSATFPVYCSGSTHLIVTKNSCVVQLQKNVLLLNWMFKTCHLSSFAYLSQLCLLTVEKEIYSSLENQNNIENHKFLKKCYPVTGTLLKTA